MITFHLDPETGNHLTFATSPLLEAVLSLHALREPAHHSLHHPWIRQMGGLPPALKREIAAFGFVFHAYLPSFFLPEATETLPDFATALTSLRILPAASIQEELLGTFFCRSASDAPLTPDQIIQEAATRVPSSLLVIHRLLADPSAVLERLSVLLGDYWDLAFHREWQRVIESLTRDIAHARSVTAAQGVYALLQSFWPQLRIDAAAHRCWALRPHDHQVTLAPHAPLLLIPSWYVWPHLRVGCDLPTPALILPTTQLLHVAQSPSPPRALLAMLECLSDETRLRLLRLLMTQPRSTQELAPLMEVSEATVSKHLRRLAETGLVASQRSSYYVLYRAVPEQLAPLLTQLSAYLTPPADLPS